MSINSADVFEINLPEIIFDTNKVEIKCHYSSKSDNEQYSFSEVFEFSFPKDCLVGINRDSDELVNAAKIVAIAAATSYYKATIAPVVKIDFAITDETKKWADALFDQGLREFKFCNDLNLNKIIKVVHERREHQILESSDKKISRCILPIGGGKDSAISLWMLKESGINVIGFSVGEFEPIQATARIAEIELVHVKRTIDPLLFELNEQGAYNGHIPVTAINSSLALVAAISTGSQAVVMSNEQSADEPTRINGNVEINHQWSKSIEAEKLLSATIYSEGINAKYFSLLGTLSEYQIFSLFSGLEKFHSIFTSCNKAFKIDSAQRNSSWCCDCDKCRFVFLGLCAFRDVHYVSKIFGKNLFEDESQLKGFVDLLALETKPFECVGTVKESRIFARKCLKQTGIEDTKVGRQLNELLDTLNPLDEKRKGSIDNSNIPDEIKEQITATFKSHYNNSVRQYIGKQKLGVIGLGRDSAGMLRFLSNAKVENEVQIYLPENSSLTKIEADQLLAEQHLDNSSLKISFLDSPGLLGQCDQVFVSPGVSKYSEQVISLGDKATTPMYEWLKYNKEYFPESTFIGVTGTKGKSTTASMIAHCIENSLVAGNLGIAVGDIDFETIFKTLTIVLEISSFQSSYFKTSPDIVVVTSLFDCHIDWHKTPENYRRDKLNLALYSPAEIVASDSIENFAPLMLSLHEHTGIKSLDTITLVQSTNKSLQERNIDLVESVINLIKPEISHELFMEQISSFKPLKYREETIAQIDGVMYISDVLSTAPLAVLNSVDDLALRFNDAKIYLLLGGANRDVDQTELIEGLNARKDRVIAITLPDTGHMIESKLENYQHCDDLQDGVRYAQSKAIKDDVVVLAPGAPSFHRYKNYEDLADDFVKLVCSAV